MHEFSAAQTILNTVLTVAQEHRAIKILRVDLEIGELTFLNPEQLEFSLNILMEGTIAEGAFVGIKRSRAKIRCERCGYEGATRNEDTEDHYLTFMYTLQCRKCGSMKTQVIGGKDCNIKSIKVRTESGK